MGVHRFSPPSLSLSSFLLSFSLAFPAFSVTNFPLRYLADSILPQESDTYTDTYVLSFSPFADSSYPANQTTLRGSFSPRP